MENVERGWQASTPKIRDRLQHVLDSSAEFPPDICFQVGFPDGQQKKMGAHRLILAAGSEVLYAMLLGPLAEKEACIRIPDLEPEGFRQMLKFLYTERLVGMSKEAGSSSDSKKIRLAFRTMECARKYDIPELYFACRTFVVKQIEGDFDDVDCGTVLIEAFGIGDMGLVDMAYYTLMKFSDFRTIRLDVETVSFDLLCHLLERTETLLHEKDLYDFCLRWAKTQCGENATPDELRETLGKAHYLIRYAEMEPSELVDLPSKDKILSSDELRLVFQKKFGSCTSESYPFSEGKRQLYIATTRVGTSHQQRATHMSVRLPIEVRVYKDGFIFHSFRIRFSPETSLDNCRIFLRLCESKYPFELCAGEESLAWDKDCALRWPERPTVRRDWPNTSDEQKALVETLFKNPAPQSSAYIVAGDVALSLGTDHLKLHMVVKPSFRPTNWTMVGRLEHEGDVKLWKGVRDMKGVNDFYGPSYTARTNFDY